ncbi:cytochrome P450 monooxygenase pc-2 [Earliella scabrosa]|nr:cytochrome P450 monooxygenase pc-2 [Earliella scabrosa]
MLPPGPKFLLRNAHYVAGPPLATFVGIYALRRLAVLTVSSWLVTLAVVLSLPVFYFGNKSWSDFQTRRKAERLGLAIAPRASMPNDLAFDPNKDYPMKFLFRLCELFGNHFIIELYTIQRFFTTEPEHIKAILATEFSSFEKGESMREQLKSILGVGVFNADGDLWKFHRSMTRPFFSKDRISHFELFDRRVHAADAIEQLKSRMREGYAVDWQDLVSRFTLDSATEFLFGKDVCSLATGLPYPPAMEPNARAARPKSEEADFVSALYEALNATAQRLPLQDAWPLAEFWHDKVEDHKDAIYKFIDPIVADALRRKAEKTPIPGEKISEDETLLGQLVNVTTDPDLIRDETLNILLAGRDTTASTLTFAVYRLAEHPEMLRRLREEILDVVGPTRRPTYDDIRNLKYMRAFINEVLRLYPPVPANIRCAVKDTVLPPTVPGEQGVFIAAGTKCIYSVFVMHRRKDLWGPDALKFDPDRFLDERLHKYLTPNPFIFLPFNAGPRICLGQQFAYNEVSFMLVRLLQQISGIELAPEVAPESVPPPGFADTPGSDGSDRVWMGVHLTMFAKGGLWVRMTEAQAE